MWRLSRCVFFVQLQISLECGPRDFGPNTPAEIAFRFGEWDAQDSADEVAFAQLTKVRGKLSPCHSFWLWDRPHVIGKLVPVICGKAYMFLAADAAHEVVTHPSLRKSSAFAEDVSNLDVRFVPLADNVPRFGSKSLLLLSS